MFSVMSGQQRDRSRHAPAPALGDISPSTSPGPGRSAALRAAPVDMTGGGKKEGRLAPPFGSGPGPVVPVPTSVGD